MTPPHADLTHVGFYVTDIGRMTDFYTRTMGMIITDRGSTGERSWVFLSRNPREHHQIVLASGRPQGAFQLINQISFRVADLGALRAYYRLLRDENAPALEAVTHGNAWSVYFEDPEGNRIELYTGSPWYVNQPMRVPVDMDAGDDALLAQTEALIAGDPSKRSHADWTADMERLLW